MITIDYLINKWKSLPEGQEGYILIESDSTIDFHVGYNKCGQRSVAVFNSPKIDRLVSSKAIGVDCIKEDNKDSYMLEFTLFHKELQDLFTNLCWDLISASESDSEPLKTMISRYYKWMKLLEKARNGILSNSKQKGLIGELLYLKLLIEKEGEYAVYNWVGPDGADQDFVFDYEWTEVKTIAIDSVGVSISSLQQLDRAEAGKLVIFFIDKVTSKGINTYTIPALVELIYSKLSLEVLKDVFTCKLAEYGYYNGHSKEYANIYYRLAEQRTYEVNDSFPKLTRSNTPSEVINVQYQLDIAAINPFRV